MAALLSQPTQISITSTNTTVPYVLPTTPGTSRAITHANENFAADVKPNSTIDEPTYQFGIFRSYGGGCYNPQYSAHGAWVAAGCGGHAAGPLFGAVAFDFTTGRWISHPVSPGEPQVNRDLYAAEISGGEASQLAFPNVGPNLPAPAHTESANHTMPGANGKGVILRVWGYAAAIDSSSGSNKTYAFDLNTNTWSRKSVNEFTGYWYDIMNCYHDPVSNKYYSPSTNFFYYGGMSFLDGNDWTCKFASIGNYSLGGSPWARSGFIMPAAIGGTRLMVLANKGLTRLFAYRMDASGVQNLAPVELPIAAGSNTYSNADSDLKGKWTYNPNDGCYYMIFGMSNDSNLYRIRPPSSNILSAGWEVKRLSITPADGRALPPLDANSSANNAQHCGRFFWVQSLGCLAWIPGNYLDMGSRSNGTRVYLIKPPSVA